MYNYIKDDIDQGQLKLSDVNSCQLNEKVKANKMPPRKGFGDRGVPSNNLKTIFTLNMRHGTETLEQIKPLMSGPVQIQSQLIVIALGILNGVERSSFQLCDRLGLLEVTKKLCGHPFEEFEDVQHQIVAFTEVFLSHCKPVIESTNLKLVKSFERFFIQLDENQQLSMFETLGHILNSSLHQQSVSFPPVVALDLQSLISWSSDHVYEETDNRLKVFLEASTKLTGNKNGKGEYWQRENTAKARKYSLYNCVENLLKARNRKCVVPPGLTLMTLAYIFGGRSKFVCDLVAATGAKGTYPLVKDQILKNSENTSLRKCQDGVEVFYSFDNVQKLFAIHRLYSQNQNKPIARIATSIVKCYPDGLLRSNIQYLLDNNPMRWLYRFSYIVESRSFYEVLDKNVLHEMLTIEDDDMNIILGRWDYDVENAIREAFKK